MRKLFIVFLYLVMLSSVFALRTCRTSGDPAEAAVLADSPRPIGLTLEQQERQ